ncbi:MAG: hypothetical protein PF541_17170 [Prolixibacteraceae bacterium]|nr:hypothetical protein [Prolixibacteraceae bacterium]
MKKIKIYLFLLLGVTFMFASCTKIAEYYIGLNMQPDMENSPFTPGLNVFGVLKTGPDYDTVNHYFEVQEMVDIMNWTDSFRIQNASIYLTRTTLENEQFNYNPIHQHDGIYIDKQIESLPGDRWTFICEYDTFSVHSSCIVPNTPELIGDIIYSAENGYSFTLKADETAFMYLVYIINNENFHFEQLVPDVNENTKFSVLPEWDLTDNTSVVYIFAYDKNLREYITTSNTLYKPNAYRPKYSTVDGGYGTFGAMSSSVEIVNH